MEDLGRICEENQLNSEYDELEIFSVRNSVELKREHDNSEYHELEIFSVENSLEFKSGNDNSEYDELEIFSVGNSLELGSKHETEATYEYGITSASETTVNASTSEGNKESKEDQGTESNLAAPNCYRSVKRCGVLTTTCLVLLLVAVVAVKLNGSGGQYNGKDGINTAKVNMLQCTDLINATFEIKNSIEGWCGKMLVVDMDIWCLRKQGIIIYDSRNLDIIRNMSFEGNDMRGMTQIYTGHIVVACNKKGLHEIQQNGTYIGNIVNGYFQNVCSLKSKIYAVHKNKVVILEEKGNTWVRIKEYELKRPRDRINSIVANQGMIYLMYSYYSRMLRFDHMMNSSLPIPPSIAPSILKWFKLAGADQFECLLLFNSFNPAFIICDKDMVCHDTNVVLNLNYIQYVAFDFTRNSIWMTGSDVKKEFREAYLSLSQYQISY